MSKVYKKKLDIKLLISFLLIFQPAQLLNAELTRKEDIKKIELEQQINLNESHYILGPGDLLNINFYDAKEYSRNLEVYNDGFVSVPFIGNVKVKNLTISQAKIHIESLLSKELLRPDISLNLINARPIKVSLVGEVIKPGIYRFSRNVLNSSFGAKSANLSSVKSNVGLPTLYDAIQKAGGIRKEANFRKITLKRRMPSDQIIYKTTNLDLIDLVLNGNQIQNPYLFDGDIIKVEKAKDSNDLDNPIFASNLSPDKINVHIVGEVESPGKFVVSSNTPLYQAVMQAGGPVNWKAKQNNFQLLRVKSNGSLEVKSYKVKIGQKLSESNNPLLEDGDVVKVKSSVFGRTSEGIKTFSEPFSGIISAVTLFKILN